MRPTIGAPAKTAFFAGACRQTATLKEGARGGTLGSPALFYFGPSGMNSASSPSVRNHSTMASCGGFSVP